MATKGDQGKESVCEPKVLAKPSTVGFKKRTDKGNSRSNCLCIRSTRRTASSESPPKLKKLSRIPTRSTFRTSAQILASVNSVGVRGAIKPFSVGWLIAFGAGKARRFTLPLGVNGRDSNSTKAESIMYSG